MRTLPAGLAAHVAGSATTLANAWIPTRRDGTVMGFTDHDRTLLVSGVACEPSSGFDRSAATSHDGFAVGDEEVIGALSSDRITDVDLAAGLYDGATVEVWTLDWSSPADALRLRVATLGEVTLADGRFRAEVRGPAAALDRVTGRLFQRTCDAELGDARCGVALGAFTFTGAIAAVPTPSRLRITGLPPLPSGRLSGGRITVSGRTAMISSHHREEGETWLTLFAPLVPAPAVGTAAAMTAGCDKRFVTCRDTYANAVNFRGFPHMPGNDFVLTFGRTGGVHDGGPVVP